MEFPQDFHHNIQHKYKNNHIDAHAEPVIGHMHDSPLQGTVNWTHKSHDRTYCEQNVNDDIGRNKSFFSKKSMTALQPFQAPPDEIITK